MKRLHIIGRKNHGKTTLVGELIEELTTRGLRVGAIKHTHHDHELDVPGKDSHRHRTAGAAIVGVLSRSMSALFLPTAENATSPDCGAGQPDRYEALAPAFGDCALVLVEGDVQTTAPKIEVWRESMGTPPLAADDATVLAMVTDDRPPVSTPVLARNNIAALADWVLRTLG